VLCSNTRPLGLCFLFRRLPMGLRMFTYICGRLRGSTLFPRSPIGGLRNCICFCTRPLGGCALFQHLPTGLCSVLARAHGAASCLVLHFWLTFPIVKYEEEVSCDWVIDYSHKRRRIAWGVIPSQSPIFPMRPRTVLVTGRGVRE